MTELISFNYEKHNISPDESFCESEDHHPTIFSYLLQFSSKNWDKH